MLVEEQKLDAVVSLPGGVFKPYAGVSTAILLFTKTNSGGTDNVWFYDMQADGWSLDDKRQPLLPEDKLGAVPAACHSAPSLRHPGEGRDPCLSEAEHARNNLPDVLTRWRSLHPLPLGEGRGEGGLSVREAPGIYSEELTRPRTAQSFCVPKADIASNGYDLSINRYKEVVHAEVEHRAPAEILAELKRLEDEIAKGMKTLEGMLK
jgi:type I restriction enzyme M protein